MPLAESLPIEPIDRFEIRLSDLPGSKSLTNRALLLAALADGDSTLGNVLFADDTRVMLRALESFGVSMTVDEPARRVTVRGAGGSMPRSGTARLENAGTAVRFLTAACCLCRPGAAGFSLLDGNDRMRERPLGQLIDALRTLGAEIECTTREGYPPLLVHAKRVAGGKLTMRPTLSSQYISALLQIGPCTERGIEIAFEGPVTSKPYVRMTIDLMRLFGAQVNADKEFTHVAARSGGYRGTAWTIEPDASNASYFLAAAAITPGARCVIEGLGQWSLQGDAHFVKVLERMGASIEFAESRLAVTGPDALRGVDVDLNDMPDMAQTLAVAALFAEGPTVIRNVGNLRVKETDRMAALQIELMKLGAKVHVEGDDLHVSVKRPGQLEPAEIDTYDDHRMAMAFSVAGLRAPGIVIQDPACVNKTFPDYWDYLARLRG